MSSAHLERRLGTGDAVAIGAAAMVGAGVFAVGIRYRLLRRNSAHSGR